MIRRKPARLRYLSGKGSPSPQSFLYCLSIRDQGPVSHFQQYATYKMFLEFVVNVNLPLSRSSSMQSPAFKDSITAQSQGPGPGSLSSDTQRNHLIQKRCEGPGSRPGQHPAWKNPQILSMPPVPAILHSKLLLRTCKPIPLAQHQYPRRTFPCPPLPSLELRRPAQADARSSLPFCCS